jgi:hypothetical protein
VAAVERHRLPVALAYGVLVGAGAFGGGILTTRLVLGAHAGGQAVALAIAVTVGLAAIGGTAGGPLLSRLERRYLGSRDQRGF